MGYRVRWEWCISDVEYLGDGEWGDVLENDFGDSLSDFYQDDLQDAIAENPVAHEDGITIGLRLNVVRWQVDKHGDAVDRDEAYVQRGIIDPLTVGGFRVPNRLQKELNKFREEAQE